MPVTISVINEKGGVAKTTTSVSIGGAYAKVGQRTLLIDCDPQASLTRGLIGSICTDRLPPSSTIAALFDERSFPPASLILATGFDNLSLLPGSRRMKAWNRLEPGEYGVRQFALRDLVNDLAGVFDRVLIDNPPNLEFCSFASMTAADYVLCPLQAEDYGAQGIQFVNEAVRIIRASANPRLVLLGYLRTMFQPRSAIHIAYCERLNRDFPGLVFENFIPRAAQFQEAVMAQKPISFYKPKIEAAKACGRIVEEIEARIKRLTADQRECA